MTEQVRAMSAEESEGWHKWFNAMFDARMEPIVAAIADSNEALTGEIDQLAKAIGVSFDDPDHKQEPAGTAWLKTLIK